MSPYEDGYYAGLMNERACPHPMFSLAWIEWEIGNDVGVRMHCAAVEAVYIKYMDMED